MKKMKRAIARVLMAVLSLTLSLALPLALPLELPQSLPLLPMVANADEGVGFNPNDWPGEFDYAFAYEVLELVNEERSAAGLHELKMEKSLLDSAMLRSAEIPDYFSHYRPDGTSFRSTNPIVDQENIAFGFHSPEAVMNVWMNSYAHWDNIMDPNYYTIGIGCYRYNGNVYWAQHFSPTKVSESYVDLRMLGHSNNIEDYDIERFAGANRYETAMEIAKSLITKNPGEDPSQLFHSMIIAYGGNYADALSGAYLSYLVEAPIILINKDYEEQVIDFVRSYLRPDGQVFLLGGTAVVSENVETTLLNDYNVLRLWGKDRYGTNIAILQMINAIESPDVDDTVINLDDQSSAGSDMSNADASGVDGDVSNADGAGVDGDVSGADGAGMSSTDGANVDAEPEQEFITGPCLVCSGKGFADALSASAVPQPILLVGNTLTDEQKTYLAGTLFDYTIVGGTLAVNEEIEAALGYEGKVLGRLAGSDRFETSLLVAEEFFGDGSSGSTGGNGSGGTGSGAPNTAVLAYSNNFPDGLSGAVIAHKNSAPLVLVNNQNYKHAAEYFESIGLKSLKVLGGQAVISDDTAIKCLAW